MIYGKKKFIKPYKIEMSYAYLFKVKKTEGINHLEERQIQGQSELLNKLKIDIRKEGTEEDQQLITYLEKKRGKQENPGEKQPKKQMSKGERKRQRKAAHMKKKKKGKIRKMIDKFGS